MASTIELTIQRSMDGGWPVVAEHHRAGQLLPVRSEGQLVLTGEPVNTSPRAYGEAIGRALFTGAIRDAYAATRGDVPVRVWLCVEDPALRTWRWEWLCAPMDGARWDFLSLDQRALYSLYLPSLTDRPYPPIGRRDLRALVLVANPADLRGRYGLTTFDAAMLTKRLQAVFKDRVPCDVLGRIADAVGPPTLDALVMQLTAAVSSEPYSILHIVCHGRFDRDSEETWVYLEQPTANTDGHGLVQPVSATTLIERLAHVGQLPHLVFLSVCESSVPEAEQRLGGLGQRLVRELGIPAVIGMTEPVTVPTAQVLSDAFYKRLLQQPGIGAVDRALVEAYAGLASRLDAHVPALYSRLGAQPLFSLTVDRALTSAEIRAALDTLEGLLRERAPVLQPHLAIQRQALDPWLPTDPKPLSADAQQMRDASLTAITEISQEVLDISFHALVAGEPVSAYDARQPFRGLSPFRAEDREFFFGREALVDTLTRKLAEGQFLPLLGPSGCGKSSVVLAGLMPRLQEQEPALQLAYLTPGSTPLAQLNAVQATLRDGPVVYFVDQFEEVFTTCSEDTERKAFIDALLNLATRARVIVTMRADFWGECAPYAQLRAQMQARQELIAPMTTAELRTAMEQQAAKVRLRFEADLSHTILEEVASEPGAMPLLQHALLELWKRRHGRWLRAAEYRAIGRVRQAIAQTADRLYDKLSPAEQDRMRDIFLRLTKLDDQIAPGQERRDTRRRAAFIDLVPAHTDPEQTKTLVKRLADAVLVVTSHNPVTNQDEVEVAHEALIRYWVRLRSWLNEDLEQLRLRDSVTDAATEWKEHSEDPAFLIHRGGRLEATRAVSKSIPMTTREQEYLAACASLDADELAKARVIAAKLKRRAAYLGILAIALLGFFIYSFISWRDALHASVEANSRYWASEGARLFASFPERGLKLAALAASTVPYQSDASVSALGTLWHLLGHTGGRPFDYGEGLIAAAQSDDEELLAMAGRSGVVVRDVRTGNVYKLSGKATEKAPVVNQASWIRFVSGTRLLVVADTRERGTSGVCKIDLTQGFRSIELECDSGGASSVALDPMGRWLVIGRDSGRVDFYTVQGLNLSSPPTFSFDAHGLGVVTTEFSQDGSWVATGGGDGSLRLWDTKSGPTLEHSKATGLRGGRVSAITFNSARRVLIAATGYEMNSNGTGVGRNASTINIWRLSPDLFDVPAVMLKTSLLEITKLVSEGSYLGVVGYQGINPNWGVFQQPKTFQMFSLDLPHTYDNIDTDAPLMLTPLTASEAVAQETALVKNSAGRWIAVSFRDGHIELWPIDGSVSDAPVKLWSHEGAVWTIEATSHGFVTASQDGRARVWDWDERRGVVAGSLPLPLAKWTAEAFHFINDATLLITHSYQPISNWSLAKGRFVRGSDLDGRELILGNNHLVYVCKKGRLWIDDDACRQTDMSSPSAATVAVPGRVLDTHPNGLIVLQRDKSLQLCHADPTRITCGDALKTNGVRRAKFTQDGKAVVVTGRMIKCHDKPCQESGDGGRPYTRVSWFSIDSMRLVETSTVESEYDLAYQDADWIVVTGTDARSPHGGIVYNLLGGSDLKPYIRLPESIGDPHDAAIQQGRWLLLGNWGVSKFLVLENGNEVSLLDLASRDPLLSVKTLPLSHGTTRSYVPLGRYCFFGMTSGAIARVDLESGSIGVEIPGHDVPVTSMAVSVRGQLLATGDETGVVRVWTVRNLNRPTIISEQKEFSRQVDGLQFSPNGNWLAASAKDEAPRVFSMDPQLLSDFTNTVVRRKFTPDELYQFNVPVKLNVALVEAGQ